MSDNRTLKQIQNDMIDEVCDERLALRKENTTLRNALDKACDVLAEEGCPVNMGWDSGKKGCEQCDDSTPAKDCWLAYFMEGDK